MNKQFKITSISLRNFKGVKKFESDLYHKTLIAGGNGVGKSTIYDAWLWLLTNKDSKGRADFAVQPVDENGDTIHNLTTEVSAKIKVWTDAGVVDYTLKKVLSEKWTKKRGESESQLTGTKTEYYIDDVPYKRNEFEYFVKQYIIPEDFEMYSDLDYFPNKMHWQKRREVLMKSALEYTPSNEELMGEFDLPDEVKTDIVKHGVENALKRWKDIRKKTQADLKTNQTRLDETINHIEQIELSPAMTRNIEDIEKEEKEIRGRIAEIQAKISGSVGEKRSLEAELQAEKSNLERLEKESVSVEYRMEMLRKEIEKLREDYKAKKQEEPNVVVKETCDCCGQPLPADKVENYRKVKIKEWENSRNKELEYLAKNGKDKKAQLDELEDWLTGIENEIEIREKNIKEIESKLSALQVESTEHLEEELMRLNDKLNKLNEQKIDSEREAEKIRQRQSLQERANELESEIKSLSTLLLKAEKNVAIIERFMSYKAEKIEESVNEMFETVKFRLFKKLLNGGIEPTCEVLIDGVPYNSANTASKYKAGLEIINKFSESFEVRIPLFLDDAEHIVSFNPFKYFDWQLIILAARKGELTIKEFNN